MSDSAAVVVAAGEGRRFGEDGPRKQFVELAGRPLLAWSCRALASVLGSERIVAVLPPDVATDPPTWLDDLAGAIVAGGETRRASVALGLAAVAGDADVVLVHDGVRPLASPDLVRRVAGAARQGPVVPTLPVVDTLKRVDEQGRVRETLDRSALRRIQTPQGFPASVLRRVHARGEVPSGLATDDAGLCEAVGVEVRTTAGEPHNLKITTEEDLAYAAWLVRTGRALAEEVRDG